MEELSMGMKRRGNACLEKVDVGIWLLGIGSKRESALSMNHHHTTFVARAQWYFGCACSNNNISGSYQPYVASHGSTFSPASTSFIHHSRWWSCEENGALLRKLSTPGKDHNQIPYCPTLFIASARTPERSHAFTWWNDESVQAVCICVTFIKDGSRMSEWPFLRSDRIHSNEQRYRRK